MKGSGCKGVRSMESSLSLSGLRVAIVGNKNYLCPTTSPRGNPQPGQVGDLQLSGTSFRFSWESIRCDKDWFRSDRCKVLSSPKLEDRCREMPAISGGVKFYYGDDNVYASLEAQPAMVIGSCSGRLISSNTECFNIQVKLIGNRESQIGLSVIAKADSKNGSSTVVLNLNCSTKHSIHLLCDGRDHFSPISEAENCYGLEDNTKSLAGFDSYNEEEHSETLITSLNLHEPHLALWSGFWLILLW